MSAEGDGSGHVHTNRTGSAPSNVRHVRDIMTNPAGYCTSRTDLRPRFAAPSMFVAADVMEPATTVTAGATAAEARALADRADVAHLVAVDADGRLVGLVPRHDLEEEASR